MSQQKQIPQIVVPDPNDPVYPNVDFCNELITAVYTLPTPADFWEYADKKKEEFEQYLQQKFDELSTKIQKMMDDIVKQIELRVKPIKPLIEPPTTLDEVIEYCKSLAEYFAKPYADVVKLVSFYSQFFTYLADGISQKVDAYSEPLPTGEKLNLKVGPLTVPSMPSI